MDDFEKSSYWAFTENEKNQGTPNSRDRRRARQARAQQGQRRAPQGQRPPQGGQQRPQGQRSARGQQRPPQGQRPQGRRPVQGQQRVPQGQRPQGQRPVQGQQRAPQGQRPQGRRPVQGQHRGPQGQAVPGQQPVRRQRPPRNGQRPPRGYRRPQGGEVPPQDGVAVKRKSRGILPKKGDSTAEVVRKMIVIVSALVLIGCLIYFAYSGIMAAQNSNTTSKLSKLMRQDENESWADIHKKYPNVNFPKGMQIKFASLYAQNQDLVGWISIPGLKIDFPVMQDGNDTFYLRHNFNRDYTVYGTPFLSRYNNIKTLDKNSTIYAHSMRRDDQMFTPLKSYRSVDGFKKNPVIEFDTLYRNYYFKVYAVFISNGSSEGDNDYLFNYTWNEFPTTQSFVDFVKQINQRKLYSTGVDISTSDKLLTLSTCTYDFDDCRLVVVGRMVRPGESLEVNTNNTRMNPNPRFPQAWYDAKGQTNPYRNAYRWTPVTTS